MQLLLPLLGPEEDHKNDNSNYNDNKYMITTATTMMTDVVVAPSFGGLLVGCVLLLTVRVWESQGLNCEVISIIN